MVPRFIGGLTRRQLEVVGHAARGLQNKEIADRLDISEHTVKATLHTVYEKLPVHNRYDLLKWAIANKLLTLDEIEREIFDAKKRVA